MTDPSYNASFSVTFGPHELTVEVPAGVWHPTPHGVLLGRVLAAMDFSDQHVLELGTGCGIHAILLARQGAGKLTLTEIAPAILENARHNLKLHGVDDIPVEFRVADWTHVDESGFDAVVSNPPFCKSGKTYRRYFIDRLILDTHKLLRSGGSVVFVQSSMADIPRSIRLMEENGMSVEVLGETDGRFRDYYYEDAEFMREIEAIPDAYTLRDGVHYERLTVLRGRL